jgi:hypothetical protein
MTVGQPITIVVGTGTPVAGLTPLTVLVTRAAGLPPINTVGLPMIMGPTAAAPETKSPITAAGCPPISTLGMPGPVIASPVAVISPILAAGNGINYSLFINILIYQ